MRSSRSATELLAAAPRGFAHRGLHGAGVPENSLAAFRAAIESGAGIECDVRRSADGVPMVFHDADLNRLCGNGASLDSLPARTLQSLRLGKSDQSIPTLGEMLAAVSTAPLLIELKTGRSRVTELCRAVARDLDRYEGPFAVMSFDPRVPRWFAAERPAFSRGLVLDGEDSWWRREWKRRWSRAQFAAVQLPAIERQWVSGWRNAGMGVACWTIRDRAGRWTAEIHADALIWEGDGRP